MNHPTPNSLDVIVSLAKRRGFVYPAAEIYGGTGSVWDYGPLGVEMKRNIKDLWWSRFVRQQPNVVGLDSSIITKREVLQASGHEGGFTDPLVDCRKCQERFRYDHLLEGKFGDVKKTEAGALICPVCGGELTEPRQFNLMFKTFIGVVEDETNMAYLRPETAQGIFVNFKNVLETSRVKVPFGIGQIGKAFRNEITPGNFIFRTREFEQCELEFFVEPETILLEKEHTVKEDRRDAFGWYDYWIQQSKKFFLDYGLRAENIQLREHDKDELSHYAKGATDVEYKFPFGWSELQGIAHRGNFDLTQHQTSSGKELGYFDEAIGKRYLPEVIEPSMGVDRAMLAFLTDAYEEVTEDQEGGRKKGEVVLHLHPALAPVKAAILPLMNKEALPEKAREIWQTLAERWAVQLDESGSIGRRYRRQDEIGTPFCITVDFETKDDNKVTVRDRDTLKQDRVAIDELPAWLVGRLG
jgi:glycyl-tRNA synthetase